MSSNNQRHRAYSDPSSPISSPSSRIPASSHVQQQSQCNAPYQPTTILNLTQESLARLQIEEEIQPRPRWAHPGHQSHAGPSRRVPSVTPSTTSVSDGEDEDETAADLEPVREEKRESWLNKGKSRAREGEEGRSRIAETLPPEILVHIFRLLDRQTDVASCLKVNKTWCLYAFSVLWNRPTITQTSQVPSIARVLNAKEHSLPYATAVKRINLSAVTNGPIDDYLFEPWKACTRAERLTLGHNTKVNAQALQTVIGAMPDLVALDLSRVARCDNSVILTVAETCERLQGLNINGCVLVPDMAMKMVAEKCRSLRRLKVNGCLRLRDESLTAIARSCRLLLEVDLGELPHMTCETIYALLLNATELRELKASQNIFIDCEAFPNIPRLYQMSETESEACAIHAPYFATTAFDLTAPSPGPLRMLRPSVPRLECLKVVDLTGCVGLGDEGLKNLIDSAPKIRFLTLAKCALLTDDGVKHIAGLGKYLHHLHIAHVKLITDAAVTHLARSCTRLRYVDFACCDQLTDLSVFELATNLPKLRRIGLVKVIQVTDEAIYSLVERGSTLERIHLSYCDKVTVKAITYLLNKLPKLMHLSLTGIGVFKVRHVQQFCRQPPADFNEHQRKSFRVFSGDGIRQLRNHLNTQMFTSASDDESNHSNRRDSASSASSGVAEEGLASDLAGSRQWSGDGRLAGHLTLDTVVSGHRQTNSPSPGTFSTLAARRSSAQAHRDHVIDWAVTRSARPSIDSDNTPLETAFASATPNFLSIESPSPLAGTSNPRRPRDRVRAGDRTMPGAFSSSSSAVNTMAEDERQATWTERALPPLPTSSVPQRSVPVYDGISAADLARHRASLHRQAQPRFVDPFAQSGPPRSDQPPHERQHQDRQGQNSTGIHGGTFTSRSTGTTTAPARPREMTTETSGRRISEAATANGNGSGGSPLRWMAGIVGWTSDRDRDRDRQGERESSDGRSRHRG